MKKVVVAAVLTLLNLFFFNSIAQVKLEPRQIKEIMVHNTEAGLGGGVYVDIKVVAENGQWHSYLIHKNSYMIDPGRKSYDSALRRPTAILKPMAVTKLLNGLAVIKPAVTKETFSLTPASLINQLKKGAKIPITHSPDFRRLITQKAIDKAIAKALTPDIVMDDFEQCKVEIITISRDTIKLSTDNLSPTKQPWTINKKTTYDMAINNFVIAAMGAEAVPNKRTLSFNSLKEHIYNDIDKRSPASPIATFKWNYYYPSSLKLLNQHFSIKKSYLSDNIYLVRLKTKAMSDNAELDARVDMTRPRDIDKMISYSALVDKFFLSDNFVFKFYKNRAGNIISFPTIRGDLPIPH